MESERQIESYLRRRVLEHGGLCYKWVCPGQRGAPDRIVIFPDGRIVFTELKAEGGRLSPLQIAMHKRLAARGCNVCVLWSKQDVDTMLLRYRRVIP